MTTTINVNAHAGLAVEVKKISIDEKGETTSTETVVVEAHTQQDFHIHKHLKIEVSELAKEEKAE